MSAKERSIAKVYTSRGGEMRRIWRNNSGEGDFWSVTDTKARKRGEQTGIDILVVHAVNDEC